MKIMLVMPELPLARSSNDGRWLHAVTDGQRGKRCTTTMPYGLMVLAAHTPPEVEVVIRDLEVDTEASVLSEVETGGYDAVALSAYSSVAPRTYDLARRFSQLGPRVVLGGVHPTLVPEEARAHCDTVVQGEAEEVWPEVVRDLAQGRLRPLYRGGLPDLTTSRLPRRDLVKRTHYGADVLETSRGCPFNCKFCSIHKVSGRTMRHKSLDTVERELRDISRYLEIDEASRFILLADSNFYGDPRYMHAVLQRIVELRRRILLPYLYVGASINSVRNDETLRLLSRAGVRVVYIGFESLEQDSLDAMGKRQNRDRDYDAVVARLHAAGIECQASFIVGADQETDRCVDLIESFCTRNGILYPEINILTPLVGTDLYDELAREGRILTQDWQRYNCQEVVFQPRDATVGQIEKRYVDVLRRLYGAERLWRTFVIFERAIDPAAAAVGSENQTPTYLAHRSVRKKPHAGYNLLDRLYLALFILSLFKHFDRAERRLAFRVVLRLLFRPATLFTANHALLLFDLRDFARHEVARLRPGTLLEDGAPARDARVAAAAHDEARGHAAARELGDGARGERASAP